MNKEEFLAYYKEAIIDPDEVISGSFDTLSYKGMNTVFNDNSVVGIDYETEHVRISLNGVNVRGNPIEIQKAITDFVEALMEINEYGDKGTVSEEQILNTLESMGLELPKG